MELDASARTQADCTDRDESLVASAQQDPRAFGDLYVRHYQVIGRYLFRRTGDVHATEDLVADVFVSALRRLGSFRWRGVSVRCWLYRIATNAANSWAADRRRDARRLQRLETPTSANQPTVAEDEKEQVRRALLTLSSRHQAVIGLHYLEGLSVEETAAVLACRVGTVKSRLARARDALRAALSNRR